MYHKCQSYHVWFLRYGAWRTNFFIILNLFLPFYPTNNNPENQNFKKIKKYSWRYYHFTNVPPKNPKKLNFEKKSTSRYYQFTHVYHKWQSHDVWFLRYGARQTEFFVILDRFLPYCPPNNPKNQNFEKMKKSPADTIILHMSTKNHDHMPHCSWDTTCAICNFFFFHFGLFFALLATQNKPNQNKPAHIMILHMRTKKLWFCGVKFLSMVGNGGTDGQTEGQMEKVTYRSGCPN